jgi:hypothetical protein
MTSHQVKLLKMLQKRKVVVMEMDATHDTNAYDFKLVTLMTKNANHQGEPISQMFYTKETYTALKYFLIGIRNHIGKLKCDAFMSDSAPQYYQAWTSVMVEEGDPIPKKLLCSWHVLEAIKKIFPK